MKQRIQKNIALCVLALIMLIQCIPLTAIADTGDTINGLIEFTIEDGSGIPGETVEIKISVSGSTEIEGLLLHDITYDETALEFIGFKQYGDLINNSLAKDNSVSDKKINLGYSASKTRLNMVSILSNFLLHRLLIKEMKLKVR